MRVTNIGQKEGWVLLAVRIDPCEVEEKMRNVYLILAYELGLKTDRKKTAKDLVADEIGDECAEQLASRIVMSRMVPAIIDEGGVDIIGVPECNSDSLLKAGEPFDFTVRAVEKPRFVLKSYDQVVLEESSPMVSEGEVRDALVRFAKEHFVSKPISHEGGIGPQSYVNLKMVTMKNGTRFDPLCFSEKEYELGKGDMPDGFDENLIGLKVGEEKEFVFYGPDWGHDERAEEYQATVTVLSFLEKVKPEVNDQWVSENFDGCKTIKDLEKRIRVDLEKTRSEEHRNYCSYLVAAELAKRLEGEISDVVFEARYDQKLQSFRSFLKERDMEESEYFSLIKTSAQEFKMRLISQTREQLRQEFALDSLARYLGMKVDDDDIEAYYRFAAPGRERQAKAEVELYGGMRTVREGALRLKVNSWLVDNAMGA